jgi:predicted ABC-type exoprotein transport system permease subunit
MPRTYQSDYIPSGIQGNCLYTAGNLRPPPPSLLTSAKATQQSPPIALVQFLLHAHNLWFLFQTQAPVFVLLHVACVQNDVLVKSQQRSKQSCGLFVIEFTRVNKSDSSEQIRHALLANIDSSMMRAY